jgi:hypothetical protein
VNLETDNANNRFHCVLVCGRKIHSEFGDIAGFDTEHLSPFLGGKIRQGVCLLLPGIPDDGSARILLGNANATMQERIFEFNGISGVQVQTVGFSM